MPEIQYRRGEFVSYRAVTTFHLGDLEKDLVKDEVVEFDGSTMRLGQDSHQYSKLRGAITAGWLVPADQEGGEYVPRPAGIEVRPAESRGRDRGPARRVGVVADEERDVGNRESVRNNAAKPLGQRPVRAASTGARLADSVSSYEVVREAGTEGRVVAKGRFSVPAGSAAKSNTVEIGSAAESDFKRKVSADKGRSIDQVVVAVTGDVEEARVGDDLEDLLPDAASSGRPGARVGTDDGGPVETPAEREERLAKAKAEADARRAERLTVAKKAEAAVRGGEFGEEAVASGGGDAIRNTEARVANPADREINTNAKVSSGGASTVGWGDEGKVVGRVGQRAAAPRQPAPEPEISFEDPGEDVVDELVADASEPEPEEQVPPAAIIKAKVEMIRQFVPGFPEWDMNEHWRTRVKKALEYKNNMPVINAILSLEVESVRKHVMQGLYG